MSVFDVALGTLFTSAIGEDITFVSASGTDTIPCRAVVNMPDVVSELSQSKLRQPQVLFEIRASEVGDIDKNDVLVRADGTAFRVTLARFKDARRAIWHCECVETFLAQPQLNFQKPASSGYLPLV